MIRPLRSALPLFLLSTLAPLGVLSLVCLAGCSHADDGHSHAPPQAPDEPEPIVVTLFGERVLLFMEYPHLVQGESARFLAHFTVLATGEPVRAGSVALAVGADTLSADAPKRDGLFVPEGAFPRAGSFQARLVLTSEQASETLDLGSMTVHAGRAAALAAAETEAAASGPEPADAVPFLLEQQWPIELLLARAEPRTLTERLVVPARAAAREGDLAVVSAPAGGRLLPPPSGALPRTGERVVAGQVLGFVEPPLGAAELGQLRALDLEFDLRALDVLRSVGEADARLRLAERERERIGRLREEGLSTRQQLDRADAEFEGARVEAEAAARTQASLDALVAERTARGAGPGTSPADDAFAARGRLPLLAPIGGAVLEVRRAPGEAVAADEPLFRLLDARAVWVEGRLFEFDLPRVAGPLQAVATFAALPGLRFELPAASASPAYVGPEVDPASRTVLVRFEMDNTDGALRPGMLAELELAADHIAARVAIPLQAVIMDQGLATAYVMLEGELFQRRQLELGVRDGERIEVLSGIEPGEWVATRGAYVLRLAALSPASFGAGHAH